MRYMIDKDIFESTIRLSKACITDKESNVNNSFYKYSGTSHLGMKLEYV